MSVMSEVCDTVKASSNMTQIQNCQIPLRASVRETLLARSRAITPVEIENKSETNCTLSYLLIF